MGAARRLIRLYGVLGMARSFFCGLTNTFLRRELVSVVSAYQKQRAGVTLWDSATTTRIPRTHFGRMFASCPGFGSHGTMENRLAN